VTEQGSTQTEYVLVLVLVTLGLVAATVPLGRLLVRHFDIIDGLASLPFP